VYIYDGVPLYPGLPSSSSSSSSSGAKLLAALCGSNDADELIVTAQSGVMTVFYETILNLSGI